MFGSFSRQADTRPYTVIQPKIPLTDRNAGNAPGAVASTRMDFSAEDRVDDDELNDVIWRSVKQSAPPPPTRSAFAR
jgi:hypothetical protein